MSPDILIRIFDRPFEDRKSYQIAALQFLAQFADRSRIVFLDPNTGLAPKSSNHNHVKDFEVRAFWEALKPGEVLVFYQHGKRTRDKDKWFDDKKEQFAKAIDGGFLDVHVARSEEIAPDAAFYYVQKPGAMSTLA